MKMNIVHMKIQPFCNLPVTSQTDKNLVRIYVAEFSIVCTVKSQHNQCVVN